MDPDSILPAKIRENVRDVLEAHDEVFDRTITGYNGAIGPFEAVVNMGPVQTPPQYHQSKLVEFQQKFDELDVQGVFQRPEDIGVTI